MQAHDCLAMLPFSSYPSLVLHLILASMEAIPTNFLILIITLVLVTVFISRAITISDTDQRLNCLMRMSSVLNHLPAKVAELKKGQDMLSLQLNSVATTLKDLKNKPVTTSPPDTHLSTFIAIQRRIDELCARPVTSAPTPPSPPPLLHISDIRSRNTPPSLPTARLPVLTLSGLVTQETTPRDSPSSVLGFSPVAEQATATALPSSSILSLSSIATHQTVPVAPKSATMALSQVKIVATVPREVARQKLELGGVKSQTIEPIAPHIKKLSINGVSQQSTMSEAVEVSTTSVAPDDDVDDEEFDAFAEHVLAAEGDSDHYYQGYLASFEAEIEEEEHRVATTSRETGLRASAASFVPESISTKTPIESVAATYHATPTAHDPSTSSPTTQGSLSGSRHSVWPPMPLLSRQNPAMLQQEQTGTKTVTKQDATPNPDPQHSSSTQTTQGGLAGSRYASSTPLSTSGEQAVKNQQQSQIAKKEETPQDVLPTSHVGEIKSQATEPRMSLFPLSMGSSMAVASSSFEVTSPFGTGLSSGVASLLSPASSMVTLENAATNSISAEHVPDAAGPVSERFCSVCDKTVANDIWTQHDRDHHGFCQHCHKEVPGDWSDNRFWYDEHEKPCCLQIWRSKNPAPTPGAKSAASRNPAPAPAPHRSSRNTPRPRMSLYGKKTLDTDQYTPPLSSRGTGRPPMPKFSKQAPKANESLANEGWKGNVIEY